MTPFDAPPSDFARDLPGHAGPPALPTADQMIASTLAAGHPLAYPANVEEFHALVDAARTRQRLALRSLIDGAGLSLADLSRRIVAASPSLSVRLNLGNLLSGNTMANAERAAAIGAYFGCDVASIAPHLVVMPWFRHPGRTRWIEDLAGMDWSTIVSRGWDSGALPDRDVRQSVATTRASPGTAPGRPAISVETMVSVTDHGGRARLFYRGLVGHRRAEVLLSFLKERSFDGHDVVERRTSIGHVMLVCDILLDRSDAPLALGLIGGPLPARRGLGCRRRR